MSTAVLVLCNSHGFSSSVVVGSIKSSDSSISIPSCWKLNSSRCVPTLRSETWLPISPLCSSQRPASSFRNLLCHSNPRRKPDVVSTAGEGSDDLSKAVQAALWVLEGVYILWLFLLPYAPGDPLWAISADTIKSLIGLSLNFFFILPILNSVFITRMTTDSTCGFGRQRFAMVDVDALILSFLYGRAVGIDLIEAPVLHPMAEGLFNFVIGWTFMFAPLLFTDNKRNRYPWSLDVLWGFQMFLTNSTLFCFSTIQTTNQDILFHAFLIPYMAIRMNEGDTVAAPSKVSQLGHFMTKGAPIVGLIGATACLLSALWAFFGRGDGDFGTITDRWEFLNRYIGSERLAYAFIWDICLYIVFQPWLVGDNLQNVEDNKVDVVKYLRFFPVVGLVAYLLFLNRDMEEKL
ncbi:hypothetical protein LINPERPRIM_LOCUS30593 [Linum perenne]